MASTSNPSSKKKSSSSSSHKKKPSKKSSSEVRKRKRSRSRKRDKLRKRSRRELSVSCSDDDSRSKDSSDSEEDYRRRKGRSRTRADEKGSKKKDKRSLSVRDDNKESAIRKKRKESKGSEVSVVKKKYQHRKSRKEGSRRGARVDYFSGDSVSCSTCGGSDSEDSGFERSRRRSKGSEKNKTRKGRDKDKDRDRDRDRSRSCSSCSEHNEQSRYQSEEILMNENYSRRLKSVLSVPNEYEEDRYQGMNQNTEEVILAYDDCPSSKSNDSYEGGRKKDSFNQPYSTPEKRWEYDGIVEDDKRADTSYSMNEKEINNGKKVLDAITSKSKSTQSARISKGDVGAQYGKIDHASSMESSKLAMDSEISTGDGSSVAGDLETILRQKALENFRKFRIVRQANTNLDNQNIGKDIGVKQSHESEHEPIKTEFSRKSDDNVAVAKGVEALESGSRTRVEGKSGSNTSTHGLKTPAGNSKLDSSNTVHADDRVVDAKATQKRIINFGKIRKSNQDSLVDRRESSGQSVVKQAFPDRKSKDANTIANKFVPETAKVAVGSFVPPETNQSPGSISSGAKPIVNKNTPEPRKVAVGSSDPNKTDKSLVSTSSETKSIVNKIIPESSKVAVGNSDPSKSDEPPMSTSSEAKSIVNKVTSEPPKVTGGSSDPSKNDKASVPAANEAPSCVTPASGEHGSTESEKTAAGGSGFEQKTMTVMRGGEMVQVSYKVYIPKKTPALARRQLRR